MKGPALQWFRLYSGTVNDEKLRTLAFEDRWHFVALLCCKALGVLDADTEPEKVRRRLAVIMGLGNAELDEVARRLQEADLIDAATMQPLHWDERQYRSDDAAARQRAYRARKRDSNERVT